MLRILLIILAAIWGISFVTLFAAMVGGRISRRIRRFIHGE